MRSIGLDHNPLRRTIDRVEAWITVALVVAFMVVVPATIWLTGRAAYSAGVHTEQVERAQRYRAEAVLLADPGSDTTADNPPAHRGAAPMRSGTSTGVRTSARWTGADGREHRGNVLADERARAGQWMPVWTDSRGDLTDPPQQRVQTYINAVAAAILAGVGAVGLAGVIHVLVHRALDVRRMAQWEAAWWQFEPRWTGRS
ncbi:hypothetical protein HC028_11755 [Planosporangium flavigriseum]|nr:hypothetical protein [Planosporangium flavigriseum]NJC65170.1 hypothetical protein [Planosporangium flavigriseum]